MLNRYIVEWLHDYKGRKPAMCCVLWSKSQRRWGELGGGSRLSECPCSETATAFYRLIPPGTAFWKGRAKKEVSAKEGIGVSARGIREKGVAAATP